MKSGLVYVFDIDDTISIHTNRDYKNAKPIQPVIDKINFLHDSGCYIKLFTGRGMHSCNGDLKLIKERNEDILVTWLNDHNVKYDELIFGKPLGDVYVDDKGISVSDFLKCPTYELKGGSGSSIFRCGDIVVKRSKSSKAQYDWYNMAAKGLDSSVYRLPKIYSFVVDALYMEYVDGQPLVDCCTYSDIDNIISIALNISNSNDTHYDDIDKYCANLLSHVDNDNTRKVINEIKNHKDDLLERSTFCHGDFTLTSIIKNDLTYTVIDPNFKDDYSSYILDLAKIRQSLHDYEYMFGFSAKQNSKFLDYFDDRVADITSDKDLQLVRLMEITHWIRMYKYRSDEEKLKVADMICRQISEYEEAYLV